MSNTQSYILKEPQEPKQKSRIVGFIKGVGALVALSFFLMVPVSVIWFTIWGLGQLFS